jgi:short-subunit dehydrogenase
MALFLQVLIDSQTIAKTWAKAGAAGVVIAGRNVSNLLQTKGDIEAAYPKRKVISIKTDVSSEEDVKELYSQVKSNLIKQTY